MNLGIKMSLSANDPDIVCTMVGSDLWRYFKEHEQPPLFYRRPFNYCLLHKYNKNQLCRCERRIQNKLEYIITHFYLRVFFHAYTENNYDVIHVIIYTCIRVNCPYLQNGIIIRGAARMLFLSPTYRFPARPSTSSTAKSCKY